MYIGDVTYLVIYQRLPVVEDGYIFCVFHPTNKILPSVYIS